MPRIPIGPLALREGELRAVPLDAERRLLLVRLDGRLHALDDACNHGGCLLSRGRLEAGRVVCPCHLMAFDVRTGALVTVPRLCEDQPRFEVEERDGEAFVHLP